MTHACFTVLIFVLLFFVTHGDESNRKGELRKINKESCSSRQRAEKHSTLPDQTAYHAAELAQFSGYRIVQN